MGAPRVLPVPRVRSLAQAPPTKPLAQPLLLPPAPRPHCFLCPPCREAPHHSLPWVSPSAARRAALPPGRPGRPEERPDCLAATLELGGYLGGRCKDDLEGSGVVFVFVFIFFFCAGCELVTEACGGRAAERLPAPPPSRLGPARVPSWPAEQEVWVPASRCGMWCLTPRGVLRISQGLAGRWERLVGESQAWAEIK